MKVYLVIDLCYDGGLIGVFDNREKAQWLADLANKKLNHPKIIEKYEYEVKEWEVGKYQLTYIESEESQDEGN